MGVLQIGLEFGLYLENDLRTDLVGEINNSCDLMEACLYLGKNGFEGYYGKAEKCCAVIFCPLSFWMSAS